MIPIKQPFWAIPGWHVIPTNMAHQYGKTVFSEADQRWPGFSGRYATIIEPYCQWLQQDAQRLQLATDWHDFRPFIAILREEGLICLPTKAHAESETNTEFLRSGFQQIGKFATANCEQYGHAAPIVFPQLGWGLGQCDKALPGEQFVFAISKDRALPWRAEQETPARLKMIEIPGQDAA